jgi:LemA protein
MDLLTIGGVIVAVIVVLSFVAIYNALVALRNNINKAWADIDVLLQKRHDALTKLLDVTKGYMKYEQSLQTKIATLRSSWMSMKPDDVQGKMQNSNQLTQAFKSILAVAENYPNLQANNDFVTLQNSINELETQIADRREFYNDSVNQFNIRINTIPYNFFAGMLGYTKMPMFQVSDAEKQDVKMKF